MNGLLGFVASLMGWVLYWASLNRMSHPVVGNVMLLQNYKFQEAEHICLILHCVPDARMVPGIYM